MDRLGSNRLHFPSFGRSSSLPPPFTTFESTHMCLHPRVVKFGLFQFRAGAAIALSLSIQFPNVEDGRGGFNCFVVEEPPLESGRRPVHI
jgi:hypothetical protein